MQNLQPWHLSAAAPAADSKPAPSSSASASAASDAAPARLELDPSHPRLSDPWQSVTDSYFSRSAAEYCWRGRELNAALTQQQCPVTYTAMHGVGAPYTARAFAAFGLPAFIPTLSQLD